MKLIAYQLSTSREPVAIAMSSHAVTSLLPPRAFATLYEYAKSLEEQEITMPRITTLKEATKLLYDKASDFDGRG